jgi:hypothetical protein
MPQSPGDAVAYHRVPDGLAHHKTRPGRESGLGRVRGQRMDDEAAPACLGPTPHHGTEVLTAPQTRGDRQHNAPRRRPDQADSSARPLRRRAARMPRPARVRIRSRNPWVRARRRLFGWKVRLPLLTTYFSCVSAAGNGSTRPWRVVLTHGSLWCLLPTCGLVTSSDDNVGTRNAPAVYGRPYEGTHPPPGSGRHPLDHTPRPPWRVITGRSEGTEWQRAVHREMLAPKDALWQRAGLVSVPLPGVRRRGTAWPLGAESGLGGNECLGRASLGCGGVPPA